MRLGKFAVSQAVWFFTESKLPAIKQQDKEGGSWEEEGEGGAVLPKKSNASQVDISGPPTALSWIFSSLQIDLARIFVPQTVTITINYKDQTNHIEKPTTFVD